MVCLPKTESGSALEWLLTGFAEETDFITIVAGFLAQALLVKLLPFAFAAVIFGIKELRKLFLSAFLLPLRGSEIFLGVLECLMGFRRSSCTFVSE